MGNAARVTSKGQITIPTAVREEFDIQKGDDIVFYRGLDGRLRLRVRKTRKGAGSRSFEWPDAPGEPEEIRNAVARAVVKGRGDE